MKNTVLATALVLATGLSACNNPGNAGTQKNVSQTTKQRASMKNLVSIVEIPATDFPRAVKFYEAILGINIEEMEMGDATLGVLPNDEGTVNVVLAKGNDYKPTMDGAVLYLNAGNDLQPMLDRVKQNGGQILVPKTEISPEMGYFALFTDTEGNKLGLHAAR